MGGGGLIVFWLNILRYVHFMHYEVTFPQEDI